MDNKGILALIVVMVIMFAMFAIALWLIDGLSEDVRELQLRHDQLEDGFADFLDEYYQVELYWPEMQLTGYEGRCV